MSPIHGHSFQARRLKLGMDDHLKGADVIGYPDIRISGFSDNRIFGPQSHILRARKLKLGENHVGTCADVLGYSDIRISGFFG